jgi:hypothetical protein
MQRNQADQQLLDRLDALDARGALLLSHPVVGVTGTFVATRPLNEWRSMSTQLLESFLGKASTQASDFREKTSQDYLDNVEAGLGILRAVRHDVAAGYLTTFRERVHAELFADFLEMAAHLLGEGRKDPAAVLAGGTLEEHLRQLCQKHDVAIEEQTARGPRAKAAARMNDDLAKAGVYNAVEQKAVGSWLGLRNSAAHGKYDEYRAEQVDLMVRGVRDYMLRNPA